MSEWLSGSLELPPGAIKDSEHVSLSTQVYVVAEGQPDALELAIAMPSKKASEKDHGGGRFVGHFHFVFVVLGVRLFPRGVLLRFHSCDMLSERLFAVRGVPLIGASDTIVVSIQATLDY